MKRIVARLLRRALPRPVKRWLKRRRTQWRLWRFRRTTSSPRSWDIVCFPIVRWRFRWQRPQQILSELAGRGHRVFIFNIDEILPGADARFITEPLRENVWEVTVALPAEVDLNAGALHPDQVAAFEEALERLRREMNIVCAVSFVHMPAWHEVAAAARRRHGWRIVYDCMDDWSVFPGVNPRIIQEENALVEEADVVLASSRALFEKWRGRGRRVELVRNAADFRHFSAPGATRYLDGVKRPVIGYFGAISTWFDVALVQHCAEQRPSWSFVLIGDCVGVSVDALRKLDNVHLLGEQPYERLPSYLRDFDVCIIPFVVNELTAAVDPVKFYEYLAQGKPVVSTPLPELEFAGVAAGFSPPDGRLKPAATQYGDFLARLDAAVVEDDAALRRRRIEFARANTWPERAAAIDRVIRDAHPRASIIIISYENRALTRDCIDSVLRGSMVPNIEVVVVDNGSTDGSAEMLRGMADERVRVILNGENAGFAAANNQGLAMATGDFLVLLNNDTVVPRGWLPRMLRHLDDPALGLVNAVTNFSGNESRIPVPYATLAEMEEFAERYMRDHEGERFDIRVAAMYCVGMRRDVYERVGPLDAEFGLGLFEDDDYSHRVRMAGYRVVCAEDVFVHHYGQASFAKLDASAYDELWQRNLARFERKWGLRWQPHQPR